MLKAPGPHRREGGCHERVCVHWCPVCPVLGRINIKLFLSCSCSCFQLAHPRPLLLLLGASLRFTRPSLILPATSDYAATLACGIQLSFLHPYRPLQYELASFTCQEQWLHMVCVERKVLAVRPHIQLLFDASCHSHIRTLESHMEANRGTALSILTSIGSDMHECRLACRPMYMHHTHWSAGHPNNVRSRFAKHQG